MATVVSKIGIRREKGWLYFLDKQGDVSRARMARGGGRAPKGRQKVAKCGVEREDGGIESRDNVCRVIAQIIEGEDTSRPLSDSLLTRKLQEGGLDIARRTVTKYRERAGIAPSRLRKKY